MNRISGSRRWSRTGAHLVVVALVALSVAGGVLGARAQDLAGDTPQVESAAFPFNLVALAQAAEDSAAPLSPLILDLQPTSYQEPVSRDGSRLASGADVTEPLDLPTAQDVAAAAASTEGTEAENDEPPAEAPAEQSAEAAAAPAPVEPAPVVAVPAQPATGLLAWPVAGGSISQGFWPGHLGIDIAAPWGTPVQASAPGTVTYAGWRDNGGGYVVEISHDNGLITVYNHLSSIWVWPGQYVGWGEGIGAVGCSGLCYGSHVHFAVFVAWTPVNPLRYL